LSKDTLERLRHGERIVEILKQPQYEPMPVEKQVLLLYVLTHKYFAKVNVEEIGRSEREFLTFIEERHMPITDEIREKKEISPALEEKVKAAVDEFFKRQEKNAE
jgi:F-type H+-transporting ATPase subunit alpha